MSALSRDALLTTSDGDKGGVMRKCIMATAIKWKKNWLLLLGVVIGFALFYSISFFYVPVTKKFYIPRDQSVSGYSVWPEFQHKPLIGSKEFQAQCVQGGSYSITGLVDIKTQWSKTRNSLCQVLYDKFVSIFTLEARKAPLKIPGPFQEKVKGWLANDDELYSEALNQNIVHAVSEYTREHTIFNPLRDKRPVLPPDTPEDKYYADILKSTAAKCDFCKFKDYTAEHIFGRVESKHAFSASNIFKVDTLHALLALKKHDPLQWNLEEFLDLFQLTDTWLKKANHHYPSARYPSFIWDVLPKCGASQIHPHLHLVLDFKRHHGQVEAWRKGAQEYFSTHESNYFTDLVSIYSALNLTVTYGKAVAFGSLVPKKDHEVVVMAQKADKDFYTLLYFVLRAFIDDLHVKCFSMGVGLPAMNTAEGKLPAYARLITRGYVTDIRADISSLELFMATNVNIDPYKTTEVVRNSVRSRAKETGRETSHG